MLIKLTMLMKGDDNLSKRRVEEKQAMKVKIQNAAIEIIRSEGYDKLSLRKIAAKIDYSATNIYNYYQNKADIIKSIIIRKSTEIVETVDKELKKKQNLSMEEQFRWLVRIFIETMIDDPEQVRAVFQTGINIYADYELDEENIDGEPKILQFLNEGYQQGVFKQMNESTAVLIIVNLLGVASYILNNQINDPKQIDLLIENESNILLTGILK
ncbi:AcrR family transcriptional regulator [Breznakia sp. PF5-3]|uniref:TetR/AcrR family transcriptional regulator n=1 Tax=unclassified Breznakia TaxID=2623764 RepID=UPI002404B1D7|nr:MULTISPECIES: TetR/AcrR family transcriptional regulator [unclassified Breznakia]MDL2276041.1 TetR/AcrR family transcriptional regulator [Breznakia sp. OttesenSCG-928-G09]MDF9824316.1 AcrR family transcriptional regulator [Breznakia sp. PM6-1]MDF9835093.1 AcrR family transcriptional regulator [Breznakia sp. PF5-3]MDF9838465.1 AcrR family transcriptional regulator [Breznakia sp. PFB2-8]MDF9860523.1 AcrR family transcriptional regulator [Breznakia sp. PH5-24]